MRDAYIDGYMYKEALEGITDPQPSAAAPAAAKPGWFGTQMKKGLKWGMGKFPKLTEQAGAEYVQENPEVGQRLMQTYVQQNPQAVAQQKEKLISETLADPEQMKAIMARPDVQALMKKQMMQHPQMKKMMGMGGMAIAGLGGMNIWQMMKNKKMQQQMAAMQARRAQPQQAQAPYSYRMS